MKHRIVRTLCLGLLAMLPAGSATASPIGPGFSYQGQLIQNGNPVSGNVTMRFSLWDSNSGGNPVGAAQILPNVAVTNGLFVVQLNEGSEFGASAFDGNARWLQIEVCSDPACVGPPTVLSPRPPIHASPYALYSLGPWQVNGSGLSYSNGNVGIGTSTPHTMLDLKSGFGTEVLRFGYSDSDYHYISTGFHGIQSPLNYLGFNIEHGSNDVRRVLTLQGDGNVGIGTSTPTQKLQVLGNIFLGPSGEYAVPAGEENLRIVRGSINQNGIPTAGCCYTVSHPLAGAYDITFNTPFADIPTVTAIARDLDTAVSFVPLGNNAVRINIRYSGAGYNDDFTFIAMGTR